MRIRRTARSGLAWLSPEAADENPDVGRLYHHLAILARPNALCQIYYYVVYNMLLTSKGVKIPWLRQNSAKQILLIHERKSWVTLVFSQLYPLSQKFIASRVFCLPHWTTVEIHFVLSAASFQSPFVKALISKGRLEAKVKADRGFSPRIPDRLCL